MLAQARGAAKMKGITGAEYRLAQPRSTQEPVWTLFLFAQDDGQHVVRIQVGARTGAVRIINGDDNKGDA